MKQELEMVLQCANSVVQLDADRLSPQFNDRGYAMSTMDELLEYRRRAGMLRLALEGLKVAADWTRAVQESSQ